MLANPKLHPHKKTTYHNFASIMFLGNAKTVLIVTLTDKYRHIYSNTHKYINSYHPSTFMIFSSAYKTSCSLKAFQKLTKYHRKLRPVSRLSNMDPF